MKYEAFGWKVLHVNGNDMAELQKCLKDAKNIMTYLLQDPSLRINMERDPSRIINQIRAIKRNPCVFVDEAQKVPALFDAMQILIDGKDAHFILTGSSARKLKRHGANLLPGRIKRYHLSPLLWGELGLVKGCAIKELSIDNINHNLPYSFHLLTNHNQHILIDTSRFEMCLL